jgi:hypothetical protein
MDTMVDLKEAGVDILTFGQYLQPTPQHLTVKNYVTPEKFEHWRKYGEEVIGFRYILLGKQSSGSRNLLAGWLLICRVSSATPVSVEALYRMSRIHPHCTSIFGLRTPAPKLVGMWHLDRWYGHPIVRASSSWRP